MHFSQATVLAFVAATTLASAYPEADYPDLYARDAELYAREPGLFNTLFGGEPPKYMLPKKGIFKKKKPKSEVTLIMADKKGDPIDPPGVEKRNLHNLYTRDLYDRDAYPSNARSRRRDLYSRYADAEPYNQRRFTPRGGLKKFTKPTDTETSDDGPKRRSLEYLYAREAEPEADPMAWAEAAAEALAEAEAESLAEAMAYADAYPNALADAEAEAEASAAAEAEAKETEDDDTKEEEAPAKDKEESSSKDKEESSSKDKEEPSSKDKEKAPSKEKEKAPTKKKSKAASTRPKGALSDPFFMKIHTWAKNKWGGGKDSSESSTDEEKGGLRKRALDDL